MNPQVQRSCERGFEQALVAQAGRTAVLGEAFVVQDQQQPLVDPAPARFASARNASLSSYSRMDSRMNPRPHSSCA